MESIPLDNYIEQNSNFTKPREGKHGKVQCDLDDNTSRV